MSNRVCVLTSPPLLLDAESLFVNKVTEALGLFDSDGATINVCGASISALRTMLANRDNLYPYPVHQMVRNSIHDIRLQNAAWEKCTIERQLGDDKPTIVVNVQEEDTVRYLLDNGFKVFYYPLTPEEVEKATQVRFPGAEEDKLEEGEGYKAWDHTELDVEDLTGKSAKQVTLAILDALVS